MGCSNNVEELKEEQITFWEEYDEYYAGVEQWQIDSWNGVFKGTVREFTQSSWMTTHGTYQFVMYKCYDFNENTGFCNDIGTDDTVVVTIVI